VSPSDVRQTSFIVAPRRSAVLVKARANVGPISFATSDLEGLIKVAVEGEALSTEGLLEGRLTIPLHDLTSGNSLYDAELRRRIDTRRYPLATIQLCSAKRIDETNRYELKAEMELHNVVRTISGWVSVDFQGEAIVIRGEQTFDVRDFDLEAPATLALKIYPDVLVEMHLEAHAQPEEINA
jgi:hypothetical protein